MHTPTASPSPSAHWPTVLGIIGLCCAVIALLFNGYQIVTSARSAPDYWDSDYVKETAEAVRIAAEVSRRHAVATIVLSAGAVALAVWLACLSWALIARRPAAKLLRTWSIITIVWIVAATVSAAWRQAHLVDALCRLPDGDRPSYWPLAPAHPEFDVLATATGTVIASLMFRLPWPAFVFIWWSLSSTRSESATWRGRTPGGPGPAAAVSEPAQNS